MSIFQQIKQKLENKDARTLLENFISLSALQLIGMLLPLITLPYVLRTIGFEKYGIIVFSSSLIAYFQSLTDFSFRITAVRDVAIYKHSKVKLDLIYSKVLIIKGIFLIISMLIISLIVLLYSPFRENIVIYGLSMLMLLGYAIFPEWFFQGIEKMRYITYLNLGIKVFFTLCIFVFIRKEEDFWIYPLLQAAGLIGAGLVGHFILVFSYKLKFRWISKRIIVQTIINNFPLFINQFVPTLYNNTSLFLLGLLGEKAILGIYQAIMIIINLAITVLEIFSRVFFPFLNRQKNVFPKYKKMMFIVVSLIVVALLASYKILFWFLDINYEYAFEVLFILSLGVVGYALSNIFGLNYFLVKRMDRLVMKNTLIASLIGFSLSFPLIHFFGILGAAINLSLSRWIMGGGLYIKYLKINRNKK